jgi:hypothetical protein
MPHPPGPGCHTLLAPDATGGGPLCPTIRNSFRNSQETSLPQAKLPLRGRESPRPDQLSGQWSRSHQGESDQARHKFRSSPRRLAPRSRLACLARQIMAGTVPDPVWSAMVYRVHDSRRAAEPIVPRYDLLDPFRSRARSWRPASVHHDDVQSLGRTHPTRRDNLRRFDTLCIQNNQPRRRGSEGIPGRDASGGVSTARLHTRAWDRAILQPPAELPTRPM